MNKPKQYKNPPKKSLLDAVRRHLEPLLNLHAKFQAPYSISRKDMHGTAVFQGLKSKYPHNSSPN